MSKQAIILTGREGNELSKEQKKFNSLIKKIQKLKKQMKILKEELPWFEAEITRIVVPCYAEMARIRREILRAIHASPAQKKLTRNQQEDLAAIIVRWARDLRQGDEDQEMADLITYYAAQTHSFNTSSEEKRDIRHAAAAMGIAMDISTEEDAEAEEKRSQLPPRKERPKTAKQQEKERKLAEAAKKLNQTTKKVYFDLVRNFHPDKEQDPEIRDKKTVLMQEINEVYNADDFLKLLELQINLLADTTMTGTSDEDLKYFNILLSQQADDLEVEVLLKQPNPWSDPMARYYYFGDKIRTTQALKKFANEIRKNNKMIIFNIEKLSEPAELKNFIASYI